MAFQIRFDEEEKENFEGKKLLKRTLTKKRKSKETFYFIYIHFVLDRKLFYQAIR